MSEGKKLEFIGYINLIIFINFGTRQLRKKNNVEDYDDYYFFFAASQKIDYYFLISKTLKTTVSNFVQRIWEYLKFVFVFYSFV